MELAMSRIAGGGLDAGVVWLFGCLEFPSTAWVLPLVVGVEEDMVNVDGQLYW